MPCGLVLRDDDNCSMPSDSLQFFKTDIRTSSLHILCNRNEEQELARNSHPCLKYSWLVGWLKCPPYRSPGSLSRLNVFALLSGELFANFERGEKRPLDFGVDEPLLSSSFCFDELMGEGNSRAFLNREDPTFPLPCRFAVASRLESSVSH